MENRAEHACLYQTGKIEATAGDSDLLLIGFHKEDVQENAVTCKTCHKAIATKGNMTTDLFHQLESHPLF